MTERQDELLRREDWRFHAIDKGGTGLIMIATEERLPTGRAVGFGLPSAPALFLSMAFSAYGKRSSTNVSDLFDQHPAPQGTYPENHAPLFDYFEVAIAEVICSYSAIEAAANEALPQGFIYDRPGKRGQPTVSMTRSEIERKIPLDEKLKQVLPRALKQVSPASGTLWPPYIKLQDLRNRLIHLKAVDRRASGLDDETIWGRLLRIGPTVFPQVAIAMIGHFYDPKRRWFRVHLKP
jgi:hypothetical protein